MQAGSNGNFDNVAFDSVDTNTATNATRLSQGGSLSGGGAEAYVLANSIFDSSASGSPGFNLADITNANQASAAVAGDFFSFTIEASGNEVLYQSLSFYSNQFKTGAKIDISYKVGTASEVFVTQGLVPTTGNEAVTLENINFADFTSTEDVTWTFYLYGASSANYGTRFDDITLYGEADNTSDRHFFQIEFLP